MMSSKSVLIWTCNLLPKIKLRFLSCPYETFLWVLALMLVAFRAFSQHPSGLSADRWVDSVYKSLSDDQKIRNWC
jgi:hypothetical protein